MVKDEVRKSRRPIVMIVDIPAEIGTGHIPNTGPPCSPCPRVLIVNEGKFNALRTLIYSKKVYARERKCNVIKVIKMSAVIFVRIYPVGCELES
jgi:hypothetical protein